MVLYIYMYNMLHVPVTHIQGFIQDFLLGGELHVGTPPPPPPPRKELHLRPILIKN